MNYTPLQLIPLEHSLIASEFVPVEFDPDRVKIWMALHNKTLQNSTFAPSQLCKEEQELYSALTLAFASLALQVKKKEK
jgi:hypothetical protein